MAESQTVTKQALKKLEDQLTCAICLEAFKNPKLLQCFHVYCKECLDRLVVQDQQGEMSLCCPTCRRYTILPPATTVADLQPAFHIHHLFEIQDAFEKVKEPQKLLCGKCKKDARTATSYCRDCGEFICAACFDIHAQWDMFTKHKVVSLSDFERKVKQMDALKKVTLYCSLHQGKELELYCETCQELVCHNCIVSKHCRPEHKYDLLSDTFERHKAEITASLEPVEEQLGIVNKALEQLDMRSHELNDRRVAIEANMHRQIQQLIELLQARKAELIGQLDQFMQMKMKNLAAQKDELETVQTQLASCLSFVQDSLRSGTQGEVMKMKKSVVKQIKEMTDNFKPDILLPCELDNVAFVSSLDELAKACQQFGEVYSQMVSPGKCFATGGGLEVAECGERATAALHVVDQKERAYTTPVEMVTSELVSEMTGEKKDCSVKKTEAGDYEISYQSTSRGRHQLHIKVEGERIQGSPYPVTVKIPVQKLGTPIKTITGVKRPWGIVVNQKGEVIVAEEDGHCVSIFSPTGEKLQSFGSKGSEDGQFNQPRGVAVDNVGNILVADTGNHRIQKFTSDGKFITIVGKYGKMPLEFRWPYAIAFHPLNSKVYVSDWNNRRIQILDPNLTFSSTFGSRGYCSGQFQSPVDVACDTVGNVYVVDYSENCIQVFTSEGEYLMQFGKEGSGSGELCNPSSISIDDDNVVYASEYGNNRISVFTCEGQFLTSFGTKGNEPGQLNGPCGIAVDKNGVVYVSDNANNRVQLF